MNGILKCTFYNNVPCEFPFSGAFDCKVVREFECCANILPSRKSDGMRRLGICESRAERLTHRSGLEARLFEGIRECLCKRRRRPAMISACTGAGVRSPDSMCTGHARASGGETTGHVPCSLSIVDKAHIMCITSKHVVLNIFSIIHKTIHDFLLRFNCVVNWNSSSVPCSSTCVFSTFRSPLRLNPDSRHSSKPRIPNWLPPMHFDFCVDLAVVSQPPFLYKASPVTRPCSVFFTIARLVQEDVELTPSHSVFVCQASKRCMQ